MQELVMTTQFKPTALTPDGETYVRVALLTANYSLRIPLCRLFSIVCFLRLHKPLGCDADRVGCL